jgi:hypothetical protein
MVRFAAGARQLIVRVIRVRVGHAAEHFRQPVLVVVEGVRDRIARAVDVATGRVVYHESGRYSRLQRCSVHFVGWWEIEFGVGVPVPVIQCNPGRPHFAPNYFSARLFEHITLGLSILVPPLDVGDFPPIARPHDPQLVIALNGVRRALFVHGEPRKSVCLYISIDIVLRHTNQIMIAFVVHSLAWFQLSLCPAIRVVSQNGVYLLSIG